MRGASRSMEEEDMPVDPLVHVIPTKAEVAPLHPNPSAWGCCPCPGPAQPPLSTAFCLPKCRIRLFWSLQKAPLGLRGQEGTTRVIPKSQELWVWGLLSLV